MGNHILPTQSVGRGTAGTAVEGLCTEPCPTTMLRMVPLPEQGSGRMS